MARALRSEGKRILDHAQPGVELVAELVAAGPYEAGTFDATGVGEVNVLMGEVVAALCGWKYFSVNPA